MVTFVAESADSGRAATERAVVVVGLMGAGKSTLARVLADRLARPLRDSDPDLATRTGRTAAELAERHGRQVLHELEAQHLLEAVAGEPAVVAAAASTVDQPPTRQALAEAFVVWLDGPLDLLVSRARTGSHRPDYGELRRTLREQDQRRRPGFAAVADIVVNAAWPLSRQVSAVLAGYRARDTS